MSSIFKAECERSYVRPNIVSSPRWLAIWLIGLAACMSPPMAAPPGHRLETEPTARVPALPPQADMSPSVAAEIYATSNIVQGDSVELGPYPRDLIRLWFKNTASQADRQAAVDSVNGEVVGGYRFNDGGVYYVRIQHDGTAGPLHAAIDKLSALPQVRHAAPDLSLALQVLRDRRGDRQSPNDLQLQRR